MNERVTISWKEDQWQESKKAFEMVNWCKKQKLILNQDFVWNFDINSKETSFTFIGENKSIASYFAIIWT